MLGSLREYFLFLFQKEILIFNFDCLLLKIAIFVKKSDFSLESNLHGNNMIWCVSGWNKIQIKKIIMKKVVITSVELSCGGREIKCL